MSDPIYEIPILPPGASVAGWTPGIRPRSDADSRVSEDANAGFSARGGFDDVGAGAREPATEIFTTPSEPATEVLNRQSTLYSPPAPPMYDPPASQPMTRGEANRLAQRAAAERAAQEALVAEHAALAPRVNPESAQGPVGPQATVPAAAPVSAPVYEQPAYELPGYETPAVQPNQSWNPPLASQQEPDSHRPSWSLVEPDPEPLALRDVSLREALQTVVRLNASDLHVTVDAPPMIRVNGGLRAIEGAVPWTRETIVSELSALLTKTQAATFESELELDFAHTLSEESRFRVNYYQQRGAIGAAFRLIPTEIKKLSDLGVPDTVSRFATLPRGLVLVTGPTGSGKSTTLAGLIDLVNRTRADHIVTVEDPIEFMHKNQKSIVNQREVGSDTHSFANALKHVLRQDPDVILIGELRDLETISVALTAAETGHLVFATLHTQDAAQTIDRIIDVFPSHQQDQVRTQLAGTLQGVVSQTLVPKASGTGRVVATEVMVITPALANLIREGKTYQILSAMQAGKELGMHTMDQHLAELVNSGRITAQAAKAKAHDPDGFQRMLHGVQSPTEQAARAIQASGIDFGDSFSTKLER